MTSPSLPDNWEDLATGYALGNLTAQEAEELKRLLEEHPELAVEVERSQKTLSLIAQTGLNQPTPPHLRSKILAAASLNQVNQVNHHSTTRQSFPWAILAGSMAALLILLGYDSYRLRQELKATRQILREMQQQDRDSQALLTALRQSSVFPLVGDGEAKAAAGTAIVNLDDKEAILFVENLPPLPKGEIYRLWAIVATTPEPIFCGQFMTNLEGEIARSLVPSSEVSNTKISKLVITAELEKTPSDSPQGTIVMQSIL